MEKFPRWNFYDNFLLLEGMDNIFYSVFGSQFVATGPANILKDGQKLKFFLGKMRFE